MNAHDMKKEMYVDQKHEEHMFDSITEDLLASSSPVYLANIKKARSERKRYSLKEVRRMLDI
ncbi:hypothetical protein HY623_00365 [Candidatus Uhrbacteria bacterium]|nr:hypothetical protein [Candidatus Uhrbacteria bacterium]